MTSVDTDITSNNKRNSTVAFSPPASPLDGVSAGEDGHGSPNGNGQKLSSKSKRRRSRKGLEKQFECEEPNCGKKFTRLEHLSRHQLNHRPKEIFHCTWEGCDKTFVREDLKQRHMERHQKRQQGAGGARKRRFSKNDSTSVTTNNNHNTNSISPTAFSDGQKFTTPASTSPMLFQSSFMKEHEHLAPYNYDNKENTINRPISNVRTEQHSLQNAASNNGPNTAPPSTEDGEETDPSDLISWLFSDAMISNAKDPIFSPSFYSFDSPMSLQSLLSPPSNQEETTMSEQKRQELFGIIPAVQNHDGAALSAFQRYIAKFWAYIHPQYPILHKPSFQADNCPGGLLWAILLLGAAIDKQFEFTLQVAEPLRWYLFGSKDFHPPAKLWVIQALVMLELYEKTMSNRREHERAHIHHATTLQLLRRGSVLRGMESPREIDPWKRWIETEAAKRVALMAFVLDVFDATMFGHAMVMSVHEIRLSLPCSESIWAEYPSDKGTPRIQSTPFLVALKKLLNKSHVETGPFGRRVLLGGLLCISHQMQQRDLQVTSLGWGQFKDTWRDILGPAYNFWKQDYDTSLSDDVPVGAEASNYSYMMELQGCTSSFYHLAHMSMFITFLEAQVYAGCPSVLNQPIRQLDHENSVRKINEWAVSPYGRKAFWHSIQFLKEMYIVTAKKQSSLYIAQCECPHPPKSRAESEAPEGEEVAPEQPNGNDEKESLANMIKVDYNAYNDPVGKRPNAVYLCALMVWTFAYCLEGPETTILAETESAIEQELRAAAKHDDGRHQPGSAIEPEDAIATIESETSHIMSAEDGYEYLYRMSHYNPTELGHVKNRNQTVGLLRMVVQSLKYHNAELVQEGRRLLVHCIDRSLGRNKLRCEYMFSPKTKGGPIA